MPEQFERRIDGNYGRVEVGLGRLVATDDVLVEEIVAVNHWDSLQVYLGELDLPEHFALSPTEALELADALTEAARAAEGAYQARAGLMEGEDDV